MNLPAFALRCRQLAFWLSMLALCSTLAAPASVLAQDMRTGKWIGLCTAGPAMQQDGHADEDAHCELCALPGLLPSLPAHGAAIAPVPIAAVVFETRHEPLGQALQRPAIRAPPLPA